MIGQVRRESSTVVAVVGEVREILLAEVDRSPNVSVVRPPQDGDGDGLEAAARALRSASGRASAFVLVAADPLAAVATEWAAMWDLSALAPRSTDGRPPGIPPHQEPQGGAEFERRAAAALAAWRAGQFDLPDYYLVLTRAGEDGDGITQESGFYLGPLRAARPHRVAVVGTAGGAGQASRVLDALRSLPHGPWWPPMDELIGTARRFFAGGLAEGEQALAGPALGR
jgi:hypothetical protein